MSPFSKPNKMRTAVCFFWLLTVFACTDRTENSSGDLQSLTSDFISLTGLALHCDSVIESTKIVSYFDNHILTRRYADYIYTIYNYDSDNDRIHRLGTFARRGGGPNQFSGLAECYYDNNGNNLYLFDINGGNEVRSYKIDLSSLDNIFTMDSWSTLSFPKFVHSSFSAFVPLSDTDFLGLGGNYDQTNMLSKIHLDTKLVNDLEIDFPHDGINVKPIIKRRVYNYGKLLKNPSSNSYLYYCTNWGNYAEIIKFDDNNSSHRNVIAGNHPMYRVAADGLNSASNSQTLMGMTASVTENYIYLLPNFRTKDEYLKKDINLLYPTDHADKVYVFDWEGNYVKAYQLDKSIRELVISRDDLYLLGSSVDPDSGDIIFIRFDIR